MSVELKNLQRRMATFNLDAPAHAKVRKFPVVTQLKNGSSIGQVKPKRTYDSLTFLAGESKGGLPDSILECSEIKAALNSSPPRLRLLNRKTVAKPARRR